MLNGKQLDAGKFPTTSLNAELAAPMQRLINDHVKNNKGSDALDWMMMEKITSKIHPNHAIDFEQLLETRKVTEKYLTYYQRYSVILSTVSNLSGITESELKAHYRKVSIKDARHVIFFCMRWATKYSLKEIGKLMSPDCSPNTFHHSTIINACKSVVTGIKTKEKEMYLLLVKTMIKLRDEGIEIDLKKDIPQWYADLYNEDKHQTSEMLVVG